MLDRVANAASRTSSSSPQPDRFPALSSTQPKSRSKVSHSSTPWASSMASVATPPIPTTTAVSVTLPNNRAQNRAGPPKLSHSLFPSLPPPSNTTAMEARQLLGASRSSRESTQHHTAWGKGDAASATAVEAENDQVDEEVTARTKKKKGKEKQTLFTLGSIPT